MNFNGNVLCRSSTLAAAELEWELNRNNTSYEVVCIRINISRPSQRLFAEIPEAQSMQGRVDEGRRATARNMYD